MHWQPSRWAREAELAVAVQVDAARAAAEQAAAEWALARAFGEDSLADFRPAAPGAELLHWPTPAEAEARVRNGALPYPAPSPAAIPQDAEAGEADMSQSQVLAADGEAVMPLTPPRAAGGFEAVLIDSDVEAALAREESDAWGPPVAVSCSRSRSRRARRARRSPPSPEDAALEPPGRAVSPRGTESDGWSENREAMASAIAEADAALVELYARPLADPSLSQLEGEEPMIAADWLTPELFQLARLRPVRTLRTVPRPVTKAYAQLQAELAVAARSPSAPAAAWRMLELLPLLLFSAGARLRGGKKKRAERSRANIVQNRIDLIRDGRGREVLSQALKEQAAIVRQPSADVDKQLYAEVLRLCSLGELSRAAGMLGSLGMAPPTRDTADRMKCKLGAVPLAPVTPAPRPGADLWLEMRQALESRLGKAISSAPRGSAAGCSGDRFEFWKSARFASSEAEWAASVDVLCDLALGLAPPDVQQSWSRARGFALLKRTGSPDIRPIAAHEPARRLVTRALIAEEGDAISAQLAPAQTAIRVSGGAEALGLSARLFAERNPSWTLLKLDMSNAFGNVSRADALNELDAMAAPLLARFLRQLLSSPTFFSYSYQHEGTGEPLEEVIRADDGADQGDPAGPLLFCASFAPALREIRSSIEARMADRGIGGGSIFVGAFMDDLAIVVPPEVAAFAVQSASDCCGSVRQSIKVADSMAWSAGGQVPPDLPVPAATDGLTIAGVPIGTTGEDRAREVLERAREDCARLIHMCTDGPAGRPRCESAKRILLECIQPRPVFISHVTEPEGIRSVAEAHDILIFDTLLSIYDLPPAELTQSHVAQLTRSTARGGCGLQPLAVRLSYNFVDGATSTAHLIAQITGQALGATLTPYETAVKDAVTRICDRPDAPEPPSWTALAGGRAAGTKHWGAKAFDVRRVDELKAEQQARAADCPSAAARVESASGPGASWFTAAAGIAADVIELAPGAIVEGPPIIEADALVVSDEAAKALMRFRLGLYHRGGRCGRKTSDPKAKKKYCDCADATARHRVSCPCGPWRNTRHNRLARMLQLLVLEIPGASVKWTPRTAFWPRGTESGEPDLKIDIPGWQSLYIDVAVVYPYSPDEGRAARLAEFGKERAYPVWCNRARVAVASFSPMVFEAYGRCGHASGRTIQRLASRSAETRGLSPVAEIKRWFCLLSLRLALDQADILINS